ncbi:MAG: hypothetical protein ACRED8_05745 [Caulobacteraceae bacterium]
MPTDDLISLDPRQSESPAPRRSWLETLLAVLGFAAWLWCAFEVARIFLG